MAQALSLALSHITALDPSHRRWRKGGSVLARFTVRKLTFREAGSLVQSLTFIHEVNLTNVYCQPCVRHRARKRTGVLRPCGPPGCQRHCGGSHAPSGATLRGSKSQFHPRVTLGSHRALLCLSFLSCKWKIIMVSTA